MEEKLKQKRPRNPLGLWLGSALVLFGMLAVISGVSSLLDTSHRLVVPKGMIEVEIVDTDETRRQGLSGRSTLDDKSAMLFIFDEASVDHCIWMKDMQFALDIVWLNDQKKVIHLEENVMPETYPTSFCPTEAARYVLELNDGRAAQLGIVKDITVRF